MLHRVAMTLADRMVLENQAMRAYGLNATLLIFTWLVSCLAGACAPLHAASPAPCDAFDETTKEQLRRGVLRVLRASTRFGQAGLAAEGGGPASGGAPDLPTQLGKVLDTIDAENFDGVLRQCCAGVVMTAVAGQDDLDPAKADTALQQAIQKGTRGGWGQQSASACPTHPGPAPPLPAISLSE